MEIHGEITWVRLQCTMLSRQVILPQIFKILWLKKYILKRCPQHQTQNLPTCNLIRDRSRGLTSRTTAFEHHTSLLVWEAVLQDCCLMSILNMYHKQLCYIILPSGSCGKLSAFLFLGCKSTADRRALIFLRDRRLKFVSSANPLK